MSPCFMNLYWERLTREARLHLKQELVAYLDATITIPSKIIKRVLVLPPCEELKVINLVFATNDSIKDAKH